MSSFPDGAAPLPAGIAAPRRRSRRRKAGFAVLALCIVLGLLEALGRILIRAPVPPEAAGLPLPPKKPGVFRIIAIGESSTVGFPVRELGYVAMLEQWLKEARPDRPCELFNLAGLGKDSDFARRRLENALSEGADLFIVYANQNEFIRHHRGLGRPGWVDAAAGRSGLIRLLAAARDRIIKPRSRHAEDTYEHVPALRQDSAVAREIIERFTDNTEDMARSAKDAGVPLLLITGPGNIVEWRPVIQHIEGAGYDAGYRDAIESARKALLEAGDLEGARREISALASTHSDEASVHWLQGRLALAEGRHEEARQELLRAKESDPYPWRATDLINDTIRHVAVKSGALLLDAEKLFQELAPERLVGKEWIADNCHPSMAGNRALALGIMEVLAGRGLLLDRESFARWPKPDLAAYVQQLRARDPKSDPELCFLVKSGQWCVARPFRDADLARHYLALAEARAPSDAGILVLQSVADFAAGDSVRGAERLQRAHDPACTNLASVNLPTWFRIADEVRQRGP